MDHNADTSRCVLLVTKRDHSEGYAKRKEAWTWASKFLHDIVQEDDREWQGELIGAIPVGLTMNGFKYKIILDDVPPEMIEICIIPGLQAKACKVARVNEEDQSRNKQWADEKKKRIIQSVADIGNTGSLQSTIDQLKAMRGDGGEPEKRRRFADSAMSVLLTSVQVGAARMEEAERSHQVH